MPAVLRRCTTGSAQCAPHLFIAHQPEVVHLSDERLRAAGRTAEREADFGVLHELSLVQPTAAVGDETLQTGDVAGRTRVRHHPVTGGTGTVSVARSLGGGGQQPGH